MQYSKRRFVLNEIYYMLKESKLNTIVLLATLIVNAILGVLNTALLNMLYESIENLKRWVDVVEPFILAGSIIILGEIINAMSSYYMSKQDVIAQKVYMKRVFRVAGRMSPEDSLNPAKLRGMEQVMAMKNDATQLLLQLENIFACELLYVIGVVIFVYTLHPMLALVIVAASTPPVFSYWFKKKFKHEQTKEDAVLRRRKKAFFEYVISLKYCKETRFWKMGEVFTDKYNHETDIEKKVAMKTFHKMNIVDCVCNLTYILGYAFLIGVIYHLVSKREITVASVVTMLTIIVSIYDRLNAFMREYIASLGMGVAAFDVFYQFAGMIELETGEKEVEDGGIEISLKDVSFKYPSAVESALKEVNLNINKGEVVAIVGENGAGKSTLSKILAGLYNPSVGTVRFNGVDEKEVNKESLYRRIAYVFQDYCRYPLTIRENVALYDKEHGEKLDNILDNVGLGDAVANLPERKDTLITKEFGGTELSGGQWQRIAIARAAYKDSDLVIFDEPTAAIDPYEEVRIMKMLLRVSQGKTVVIVTHRIGAARLADKIIAVKDGMIAEVGKHEELLKCNGEYARLYNTQASWYTA